MLAKGAKPDVSAMMTRTFLALDNLAVAFAGATERLAALDARLAEVEAASAAGARR